MWFRRCQAQESQCKKMSILQKKNNKFIQSEDIILIRKSPKKVHTTNLNYPSFDETRNSEIPSFVI